VRGRGKPKRAKYLLFTGEKHENLKFDFTHDQIQVFIEMWNAGKSIGEIGKRFSINAANVALVIMDLEMAGEIKPRPGGIFGNAS
jgi:DNA-binding MarR family transcriptional regulator